MQSCIEIFRLFPHRDFYQIPDFRANGVCSTPCDCLQQSQGDEPYRDSYKKEHFSPKACKGSRCGAPALKMVWKLTIWKWEIFYRFP